MILTLNGQLYDTAASTVAQLLEEKGIAADGTAVAVAEPNRSFPAHNGKPPHLTKAQP